MDPFLELFELEDYDRCSCCETIYADDDYFAEMLTRHPILVIGTQFSAAEYCSNVLDVDSAHYKVLIITPERFHQISLTGITDSIVCLTEGYHGIGDNIITAVLMTRPYRIFVDNRYTNLPPNWQIVPVLHRIEL